MGCGLEEAGALSRSGDGTGREAAEEAVAGAGDEAIGEVAQRPRDEAEKGGDGWPGAGQLSEERENGGGADVDMLGGEAGIAEDEDGGGGARGEASEERGKVRGKVRISRRGEAEAIKGVVAEEPADRAMAEDAVTVVEDEEAGAESGERVH